MLVSRVMSSCSRSKSNSALQNTSTRFVVRVLTRFPVVRSTDHKTLTKNQRASLLAFIGYSDTSKGWQFWNPSTNLITKSSDVIFDKATSYSLCSFISKHGPLVEIHVSLPFSSTNKPNLRTYNSNLFGSSIHSFHKFSGSFHFL